jgi:hypothetical protein
MVDKEHSALTGASLHEPKGIAAAVANRVYLSNGAGSGSWTTVPASAITAAGVLVFQSQLYHIRDERSSGTSGDTLVNNSWNTRALNTEVTDEITITPSGNQLSLAAGTYFVIAHVNTSFSVHFDGDTNGIIHNKLRIRNITDSTTALVGMSQRQERNAIGDFSSNDADWTLSFNDSLVGRFTLTGSKTIELQNFVNTSGVTSITIRGGRPNSSGENEVYLDLMIWKTA